MTQHEKVLRHWRMAFLLWFVTITIATHLPQPPPLGNPVFESPDKLLHFVCFGILAFLFMCTGWVSNTAFSWLIVATWVYFDELTQDMLPLNRTFNTSDILSGELGVLAAYSWQGALQSPRLEELKNGIYTFLASLKTWFFLTGIGMVVVIFTTGLFWFSLKAISGKQQSDAAFTVGIIAGVIAIVTYVYCGVGKRQSDILYCRKNLVLFLVATIGIPAMIAYSVPDTFADPWVLSIFASVLGTRVAWHMAT